MNATVSEWVAKAEADLATAERELVVESNPNYDGVCFHAQQAIEKLMKALIIHRGGTPSKTHRLVQLDKELNAVCSEWEADRENLRLLSRAAVDFRYPGESADFEEASESVDIARTMRTKLLVILEK